MNSCTERLKNGIITENPTFVMMLGMCPTLAVTSSAINGLGMGLTTTAVLILSNVFISLLRKVIPDKVRIPAFIVIVATFVTLIQLLLQAYLPSLNKALETVSSLAVQRHMHPRTRYFRPHLMVLVWDLDLPLV